MGYRFLRPRGRECGHPLLRRRDLDVVVESSGPNPRDLSPAKGSVWPRGRATRLRQGGLFASRTCRFARGVCTAKTLPSSCVPRPPGQYQYQTQSSEGHRARRPISPPGDACANVPPCQRPRGQKLEARRHVRICNVAADVVGTHPRDVVVHCEVIRSRDREKHPPPRGIPASRFVPPGDACGPTFPPRSKGQEVGCPMRRCRHDLRRRL